MIFLRRRSSNRIVSPFSMRGRAVILHIFLFQEDIRIIRKIRVRAGVSARVERQRHLGGSGQVTEYFVAVHHRERVHITAWSLTVQPVRRECIEACRRELSFVRGSASRLAAESSLNAGKDPDEEPEQRRKRRQRRRFLAISRSFPPRCTPREYVFL